MAGIGDVSHRLFTEFAESVFVSLAEFAHGLVADLADALALQVHILGYLGHRLMLLVDAEEGIDYPTLTLIEHTEGKLYGILDGFGMDALIGKGCILIDEHGEQAHIGAVA